MKKYVIKYLTGCCLLFATVLSSSAQDCQRNLEEAQRAYFNGQFEVASNLLRECINSSALKAENQEALEVYIKSQLLLDRTEEASKYVQQLLTIYPDYTPGYQEMIRYTEMIEQYKVTPKSSWTALIGTNIPFYQVMQYHSYGSETVEPTRYEGSLGLSIGGGTRIYLKNQLSVDISALFQSTGYQQTEFLQDYLNVSIEENMYFFSVPLTVNYSLSLGNIRLTTGAGMVGHFRIASIADFQVIPTQRDLLFPFIGVPQLESGYNISKQRKQFTYGYTGFVEAAKSHGKHSFFINVAYEYGHNNQIKTESRYTIAYVKEKLSYVPDDFKYDAVRFSLGYRRTLFKVEKK